MSAQKIHLTDNRKHSLEQAVFSAYAQGWNGKLSQTSKRPLIDGIRRHADRRSIHYLREVGLIRPLAGQSSWDFFLTAEAIKLVEELHRAENDGSSIKAAAEAFAEQVRERDEE